jgi:hypothetical protein
LEESISRHFQGLTLGNPWFSTRADQDILRPVAPSEQDIDGLGFVHSTQNLGERLDVWHFNVAD